MIKITDKPLSPESIVSEVKTPGSGCALSYVGLIRNTSYGKQVTSVEYSDPDGIAEDGLHRIADELKQTWELNEVSIYHRIGKLNVGDINLVIAISSAHRGEAFSACQRAVDLFKEKLPTSKVETYTDGSTKSGND
jgi:molybdopterin synthase catalytic subunit